MRGFNPSGKSRGCSPDEAKRNPGPGSRESRISLRSIRATMFANVIARSDLSTGKSQHGRRMGGACETHHLYKMQLLGIASAFRLRSASYGGRSRSLSYGGQVAPLIRAPVRMASSARWRVKDRGKR